MSKAELITQQSTHGNTDFKFLRNVVKMGVEESEITWKYENYRFYRRGSADFQK